MGVLLVWRFVCNKHLPFVALQKKNYRNTYTVKHTKPPTTRTTENWQVVNVRTQTIISKYSIVCAFVCASLNMISEKSLSLDDSLLAHLTAGQHTPITDELLYCTVKLLSNAKI